MMEAMDNFISSICLSLLVKDNQKTGPEHIKEIDEKFVVHGDDKFLVVTWTFIKVAMEPRHQSWGGVVIFTFCCFPCFVYYNVALDKNIY